MALNDDDLVTISLTLPRKDFNKLTHMTCKLTYEEALRDAALEQICSYHSRSDPHGLKPYVVRSPIDAN